MNYFEHEMRVLFERSPVIKDAKFCGKTMIGKLDDDLRVKLSFCDFAHADHYSGIMAKIINRTEGVVDSQAFRFSDILGPNPVIKNAGMCILDCGADTGWSGYKPAPSEMKEIADTITDYISMYQSDDMSFSDMSL